MYLHFFFNKDVKRNWGQVKSHFYGIFLTFKISKMPPRGRGPIWQGNFIHFWEEIGEMPKGPPLSASPLYLRGIPTALLVVTEGAGGRPQSRLLPVHREERMDSAGPGALPCSPAVGTRALGFEQEWLEMGRGEPLLCFELDFSCFSGKSLRLTLH